MIRPARDSILTENMRPARNCLSVASAGLVLAGSLPHAESATITTEGLTMQVVGGNLDVLFDPIDSVSDLVAISDGPVFTQEGGSMVISAILSNDSIVQLFSAGVPGFQTNAPLASFTGNSFTDFSSPETVKGLRFTLSSGIGPTPQLTLPVGTTFTFTVPEPSAALFTMLGLTFLGIRRSRSRA